MEAPAIVALESKKRERGEVHDDVIEVGHCDTECVVERLCKSKEGEIVSDAGAKEVREDALEVSTKKREEANGLLRKYSGREGPVTTFLPRRMAYRRGIIYEWEDSVEELEEEAMPGQGIFTVERMKKRRIVDGKVTYQMLRTIMITFKEIYHWLMELAFAYNTAQHDSTRYTPAYLNYGRKLRPPAEQTSESPSSGQSRQEALDHLQDAVKLARRALAGTYTRQSKYYNQQRRNWTPAKGDYVMRRAYPTFIR
nr:PREDICTED: uncharacterized protein LOC105663874 isoform X2 [Megachile rotundata]